MRLPEKGELERPTPSNLNERRLVKKDLHHLINFSLWRTQDSLENQLFETNLEYFVMLNDDLG